MIAAGYVREMARYNAWQNNQLVELLKPLSTQDLTVDRGAFFGSILGTLNHLLWGDLMWMSRFVEDVEKPAIAGPDSPELCPTFAVWTAERFRIDGRIRRWADGLSELDLRGDLTWYSGVLKFEVSKPLDLCIVHFFNHQTHHRGQVHAMLTSLGREAPVSDLFLMPEDV